MVIVINDRYSENTDEAIDLNVEVLPAYTNIDSAYTRFYSIFKRHEPLPSIIKNIQVFYFKPVEDNSLLVVRARAIKPTDIYFKVEYKYKYMTDAYGYGWDITVLDKSYQVTPYAIDQLVLRYQGAILEFIEELQQPEMQTAMLHSFVDSIKSCIDAEHHQLMAFEEYLEAAIDEQTTEETNNNE